MSLHQKQYSEPPAIELDVARLRRYVTQLRAALTEMVEKGEGCVTESVDCSPLCCRYGRARKILADTQELYFQHER